MFDNLLFGMNRTTYLNYACCVMTCELVMSCRWGLSAYIRKFEAKVLELLAFGFGLRGLPTLSRFFVRRLHMRRFCMIAILGRSVLRPAMWEDGLVSILYLGLVVLLAVSIAKLDTSSQCFNGRVATLSRAAYSNDVHASICDLAPQDFPRGARTRSSV